MKFTKKRRMLFVLALVFITPVIAMGLMSSLARRPAHLGVRDGRLAACPGTPNCVSTQEAEPSCAMEPIPWTGTAQQVINHLCQLIAKQPRASVVTVGDRYLHAEFTSLIFRFVDDVEFFVDEDERVIHFRSASRVGHSDLGANRRRMESIRRQFMRQAAASSMREPPSE